MSRVLLVGVAVAGAAATTSAFTAANTFTGLDNNVAGYGDSVVSGVNVSNIAYTPAADATRLQSVIFTVDRDTTSMPATMTLTASGTVTPGSSSTCVYALDGAAHKITCTLGTPVLFTSFDRTGLTVASS